MNIFDILVIQPIFNLLLGLYSLIPGGDFGIALIIFTVIVRTALWPIVKKQLHQTKAMQKLQPELTRIKKESKGNKQLEAMQMMELYKKYDISPFRSFGILLIQLPIFIALYQAVQIFTSNRGQIAHFTYDFMKNFEPVKALIADPSILNERMFGVIDLAKQAITTNPLGVNVVLLLIAIMAAITQYFMTRQITPKSQSGKRMRDIINEAANGKEADQTEMNAAMMKNMNKFMPVMMFFVMINLPGTLVLYYFVSNLVAVLQQHQVLKKDSQELVELADQSQQPTTNKKATAKAREKQAREATIIRISAKDNNPRKPKKEEK